MYKLPERKHFFFMRCSLSRGGFEGGWLDWKSCVQGIFRRPPPPNYYSLHHSSDDDAGGGGGGDEGGFWARTVLSLSYLGGDKCPVAFISQSKCAEVLIMHSLVFQFSSETICLMSDDQQSNRLGHDEK